MKQVPEQTQESRPADGARSVSRGSTVTPPFLSAPVWDISDDEIDEWKRTGKRFAAYTAERIRDGQYDNGQEVYPYPGSPVYREISRSAVDEVMGLLAGRGMARKSGGAWLAIARGRMEPSTWRAVGVLLARRADLPPALAAELESWKLALDALNAPGGASADQAAVVRAVRPARPAHSVAVG